MSKQLYNTREVADVLGTTEAQVRKLCREGRLASTRLGVRKISVTAAALNRFIAQRSGETANEQQSTAVAA